MSAELRQYEPGVDRFTDDGYPLAWREIKHVVRQQFNNRCVRCHHPYRASEVPDPGERGEWSTCDETCAHGGPLRLTPLAGAAQVSDACRVANGLFVFTDDTGVDRETPVRDQNAFGVQTVEARWRILTVHHLDGDKANCRWWNLVPLCQRCHLSVQARVKMDVPYDRQHSLWFQPFVAGFYAFKYLGEDLPRSEVEGRLEELLLLELRQERLFAT